MNRKKAVINAMKSLELEGFVYTKSEKSDFEKLANGQWSHADMRKQIVSNIEKLRKEKPEAFLKKA